MAKNSRGELNEFGHAMGMLNAEMKEQPFTDVPGPCYIEIDSKFSRDLRGEFYTPKPVGDMMGGILVDVSKVRFLCPTFMARFTTSFTWSSSDVR